LRRIRVIPVLLLQNGGLVKTIRFKKPNYIGDPINAVRIFNDKEVDELVILDISVTQNKREPNFEHLEEIVSEAFMPLGYGGGVKTLDHIKKAFNCGIEKVIINTSASENQKLLSEAASIYGSQSIVASVDVGVDWLGKKGIYTKNGKKKVANSVTAYCKMLQEAGAGEIILTSIHREGTFRGYDTELINEVCHQVHIPVVANGGARHTKDFKAAIDAGASAVAAGSRFVYTGRENGILINYPTQKELIENLFT